MMKRITRDKTVPPDRRYEVREPVAEVELGETFVVETINFRTPIIRTPKDTNPANYREREETGPIFVKGIEPGDVLRIHIQNIRPEGHASGGWWRVGSPGHQGGIDPFNRKDSRVPVGLS